MERIGIETTQNVLIDYRVANVGERIAATLIDGIILGAYFFIVNYLVTENFYGEERQTAWIIAFLPYTFYHLLMEIFLNGQSLGKKALKIKVTRIDGAQPTIGNYIVRWIFRIVDIGLFAGIIAIVVIASNGKGQRLGDIVAKTTVISLKRKESLNQTPYTDLPDDYEMRYPDAYMLSEEDIRTIREVLDHYKLNITSANSSKWVLKTAQAVENKINNENNTTPAQFLETVIKDYNYYYTKIASQ